VIDTVAHGPVTVAWRRRVRPVMQPTVTGNVAVAVVRARGDELDIVGLAVGDGHVVWRYPFYTPDAVHSAYFWPPVFTSRSGRSYAVFQRADTGAALKADQAKPYLAVDPATGRIAARTRPMVAIWHATPCDFGGTEVDVCLETGPGRTTRRWRLDDFTIHTERDPHDAGKSGVYTVYGESGIVTIGREASRGQGWRHRISDLVGRHWEVDRRSAEPYVGHGVVVISAEKRPTARQERRLKRGGQVPIDRGLDRTFGIDLKTGRLLWSHDDGELNCPSVAYVDAPIRCAFTGTLVFDKQWQAPRFEHIGLRVEGYDPTSGATTWSTPLESTAAEAEARQVYQGGTADDHDVVVGKELGWLPARSGPEAVAWNDGSHLPLSSGLRPASVLLCENSVHFGYATDGDPWPIRDTDTYVPCRVRRVRRPGGPALAPSSTPSAVGLAIAGAAAGPGRYVVAYADRLVSYRVGPR
jgi:hypothetical protein